MKTKKITFDIDLQIERGLKKYAKEHQHRNLSLVIRQALKFFLDSLEK